jgi:hypothetical protein
MSQGGQRQGYNQPQSRYSADTASQRWHRHSAGGLSTVDVPYVPRTETTRGRLDTGARVTTITANVQKGDVSFFAMSLEFEGGVGGNPLALLDEMLEGFLGEIEGLEITSSAAAWRNGHPGTVLELQNQDLTRRIVVHQYVGRSHAYLFSYAVPTARAATYQTFEATFFSSITLDGTDAPSPAGTGVLDLGSWSWVYPPEADFAATMPGSPRREDSTYALAGETYDVFSYVVRSADSRTTMRVRFLPIVADARPEDILSRLSTDSCQGGGVVRSVGPAQRTGYGGQKLVIDTTDSVRYVMHILRGNGIFEISYEMPRADEASSVEPRRRFFSSFMFP